MTDPEPENGEPEIRTVFCEALECAASANQIEYLEHACQARRELRSRVEALLRAHRMAGSFFEAEWPQDAATDGPDSCPITEHLSGQVGPYTLEQEISHGGMGVVCLDEQREPFQRYLALGDNVADLPVVKSRFLHALGQSYAGLELDDEAEQPFRQFLQIGERVSGVGHPDTLAYLNRVAVACANAGRTAEAIQLHEDLLALQTQAGHPDSHETSASRALTLLHLESFTEAEQHARGLAHAPGADAGRLAHGLRLEPAGLQPRRAEEVRRRRAAADRRLRGDEGARGAHACRCQRTDRGSPRGSPSTLREVGQSGRSEEVAKRKGESIPARTQ